MEPTPDEFGCKIRKSNHFRLGSAFFLLSRKRIEKLVKLVYDDGANSFIKSHEASSDLYDIRQIQIISH